MYTNISSSSWIFIIIIACFNVSMVCPSSGGPEISSERSCRPERRDGDRPPWACGWSHRSPPKPGGGIRKLLSSPCSLRLPADQRWCHLNFRWQTWRKMRQRWLTWGPLAVVLLQAAAAVVEPPMRAVVHPKVLWWGRLPGLTPMRKWVLGSLVAATCSPIFSRFIVDSVFQAPDMSSSEDFPSFGAPVPTKTSPWGPKRF